LHLAGFLLYANDFKLTTSGEAMGAGGEDGNRLLFSASRSDVPVSAGTVWGRDLMKMPLLRSAADCTVRGLQHQQWGVTR